jgi:NADH-quinone oxidoreductase subunit E
VLAGFHDGLADEGVGAGPASLAGLKAARAAQADQATSQTTAGKAQK